MDNILESSTPIGVPIGSFMRFSLKSLIIAVTSTTSQVLSIFASIPPQVCKCKHLCSFWKSFLRVILLPVKCLLFLLICWISTLLPASFFAQKAIKKCVFPEAKVSGLFCLYLQVLRCIRSAQRQSQGEHLHQLLWQLRLSILWFPACKKYSTNRNHFLLETYKEVHNLISPHVSKQITTTSFSRELSEQVAIFQIPFRKDDLIVANPLSKNDLPHPVSSSKGISTQSAYETFLPAATVE